MSPARTQNGHFRGHSGEAGGADLLLGGPVIGAVELAEQVRVGAQGSSSGRARPDARPRPPSRPPELRELSKRLPVVGDDGAAAETLRALEVVVERQRVGLSTDDPRSGAACSSRQRTRQTGPFARWIFSSLIAPALARRRCGPGRGSCWRVQDAAPAVRIAAARWRRPVTAAAGLSRRQSPRA